MKGRAVLPLVKGVLSLLTTCAKWVQVLSASEAVTLSLVRLACRSIKSELNSLQQRCVDLRDENPGDEVFCSDIEGIAENLELKFDHYFGDSFYDYWIYVVAEFLDPRTYVV